MNIGIPRPKLGVMALNDADAVAHPFANLEDGDSFARENGSEAVAHDVRRDPLASLGLHVVGERAPEIITITPATVTDIGTKRKLVRLLALQVALQELREWTGKWDAAILAVLWSEAVGLADMQRVANEPVNAHFYNFSASQSGIKAAKQNEAKIVIGRIDDEIVFVLLRAKQKTPALFVAGEGYFRNGIVDPGSFDFDAPHEEAAQRHHVALSGGFGHALLQLAVKALDVFLCNTSRCERGGQRVGELAKGDRFGSGRLLRVFVHAKLVGNEAVDLVRDVLRRHYERVVRDLRSLTNGIAQVACLQVHPIANAADLSSEPVRAALQVKILHTLSVHSGAFTDAISKTSRFCGKLRLLWCAVQVSNLRPLPCQGSGVHRTVHSLAFTGGVCGRATQ